MRLRILLVLGLLVLGLAAVKFFWPKSAVFKTVTVEKKTLNVYIETSGKVKASQEATLSFPILGNLEMVASVGAQVKKGEMVARLKTNDLWANLQQAYANLNKARSTFYYYLEVKSQTDAASAWKSDQTSIALVNQANNNVAAAQDSVEAAEFAVDSSRAAYNKAFLMAPFDGVIGQALVKIAETVAIGQTVLTVVNPTSYYFESEIDEVDVKNLKPGQKAKVKLDFSPGISFEGEVLSADLTSHLTTSGGTAYYAKVSLESSPSANLRPGLNGEAQILKEVKKDVLTLPAAFITQKDGRSFVLLKRGNGYESHSVEVGDFVDGQYEILGGVAEGDTVLSEVK